MAYTVKKREMLLQFRDIRNNVRNRTVEISGANVLMDDDAVDWDAVSKSALLGYWEKIQQLDMAVTADNDSEVKDTCRLYFLMDDNTQAHFDIPDPKDDLFIATTGAGANIVKEYDDMSAIAGNPAENLKAIIDRVLTGDILISDGETPVSYLRGVRL